MSSPSPFEQFSGSAQIFKAFSDEKRLSILSLLREGEQCVCELTDRLNIAQSALSYHMKILLTAGIVHARQNGKWTHYSIDPAARTRIAEHLLELTSIVSVANQGCSCTSRAVLGGSCSD